MFSLLMQVALVLMPLSALAADANYQEQSNRLNSSYVILVSSSKCTGACDSEYIKCTTRKGGGKDMKQCSDDRRICYRRCAEAVSRSECTNGCESGYIQCGKKGGKDMKQCSNDRKSCYRRCS